MEYITGLELEAITIMFELDEIKTVIKNEDRGIELTTTKGNFEIIYVDYAIENKIDFSKIYKDLVLIKK